MKHLLNNFILIALLGFSGVSLAEPAVEAPGKCCESVMVESSTSAPAQLLNLFQWRLRLLPSIKRYCLDDYGYRAVILMVIPGWHYFMVVWCVPKYALSANAGLVIFSMMAILWAIYGYSIAFTEGNPFFGGLSKLFLIGITPDSLAATFSKGLPSRVYLCCLSAYLCRHHSCVDHWRIC